MSASTPPPSPQPQVGQHRPSTPPVLVTKTIENWKDRIVYRVPSGAKEENLMIDFVNQHFVPYEPLNVSVNMCEPGYRMAWFDNFCRKYISEGLSLMAFDTDTNELVGVSIATECKQSPEPSECSDTERPDGGDNDLPERWAVMPVKFGKVLDFLGHLASSVDMFTRYNCQRYLELFILTTHSTKRYPGLGTEMTGQMLALAKQKDFDLCVTEATSFYSQKIFARLGFEVLKEIPFEEYLVNEKIVFQHHGPHMAAKLMAKTL